MNKFFNRIKNTVLADMNEILDKKENKNPIGLLNQYLKDCVFYPNNLLYIFFALLDSAVP